MGDRVSVAFKNGNEESVTLFNHWGGIAFVDEAKNYIRTLLMRCKTHGGVQPLDRLEPNTVMVDFIREVTHDMPRVESSLYLGRDGMDGNNSDNGHFVIDVNAPFDTNTEYRGHDYGDDDLDENDCGDDCRNVGCQQSSDHKKGGK